MRPATVTPSEQDRLKRIAADYQTAGYEVTVQPRSEDLPDFLSRFQPDLVARGKGETIVVEVKSRRDLSLPLDDALEAALRNRPGWRFELVIEAAQRELGQTLTAAQIRNSLQEAAELQQDEHLIAALLLLWSAAEGALRLLASNESVELESLSPGYLLTRLYTLGLLSRDQYRTLDDTMRLRNQAAHGYHVSLTHEILIGISAVVSELLAEVEAVAA